MLETSSKVLISLTLKNDWPIITIRLQCLSCCLRGSDFSLIILGRLLFLICINPSTFIGVTIAVALHILVKFLFFLLEADLDMCLGFLGVSFSLQFGEWGMEESSFLELRDIIPCTCRISCQFPRGNDSLSVGNRLFSQSCHQSDVFKGSWAQTNSV